MLGDMATVRIARVYDEPASTDGLRILVDRIWPRGLSKADAALDEWCRDVAPSTGLRRWYAHDPARFAEFARRYRAELEGSDALAELRRVIGRRRATLLTATKDLAHSQAAVLRDVLEEGIG
jgi:uncharacterized protein YeaO (DUF488 family)